MPSAQVDAGLGGANILELALMNKVGLSGDHDADKPGRVVVRDPAPTGATVLDAALTIIAAHPGSKPATLIRPLAKNLRHTLLSGWLAPVPAPAVNHASSRHVSPMAGKSHRCWWQGARA